mgnify:CR=1 FL=1
MVDTGIHGKGWSDETLEAAVIELLTRVQADYATDPERVARELLEFCGLDWDPAVLRFHASGRVVNTASYDQVRRPIHTSSRWGPAVVCAAAWSRSRRASHAAARASRVSSLMRSSNSWNEERPTSWVSIPRMLVPGLAVPSTMETIASSRFKRCHRHAAAARPYTAKLTALVEDIVAKACREYVVHARGSRSPDYDIRAGGKRVYFCTAGSAVTTYQYDTKDYRPSTLLDVYDFVRLIDQLDNIHLVGQPIQHRPRVP